MLERRALRARWAVALLALSLGAAVGNAASSDVDRYAQPVTHYGHFALGRPHEYAQVTVTAVDGKTLSLTLPQHQVFEDLAPRRVQLDAGGPVEWLTIISERGIGARLALLGVESGGLRITALSAAIGTTNRWLNPVGVADLDGDGQAEVAAVITPHIGGTLKIYRRVGNVLQEVAAEFGFSNHVYGSTELQLSAPLRTADGMRLLVPDRHRKAMRVVRLHNDRLIDAARCELPAAAVGPLTVLGPDHVTMVLSDGSRFRLPPSCLR